MYYFFLYERHLTRKARHELVDLTRAHVLKKGRTYTLTRGLLARLIP